MKFCSRLSFFVFTFHLVFSSVSLAHLRNAVRIYAGAGASHECIEQAEKTFNRLIGRKYTVSKILPGELKESLWVEETALLVMPGGADIPYTQDLNGEGNQIIRRFVEEGGVYMGFCAGAYYAGGYLEFAKGNRYLEVVGPRELAFFPGTVQGPVFEEEKMAKFSAFGQNFEGYYNGGGQFVDAESYSDVEILARYEEIPEKPVAMVQCKVGNGLAFLSGIHIEYDRHHSSEHLSELWKEVIKGAGLE